MSVQHESICFPPKEHTCGEKDWDSLIQLFHFVSGVLSEDHPNTLEVPSQEDQMYPYFLEVCLLRGFYMLEKKKSKVLDVMSSLKLFLQSGAKWDSVIWEPVQRPYHIICQQTGDQHELLDRMIEADNSKAVNTIDSSRCTPLMYAVREANLKCVKSLIRNGADIDHVAERPDYNFELTQYLTPLIDAIFSTNRDIFDFLLESGVDVNKPDCGKRTPLMHAAYAGSVECVEKLLQKGARLDVTDQNGQCAWTYAEKFEVFKCMLDHGLDKNAIDSRGRSVLYFVVKKCNVFEVRYILEQGVTLATDIPEIFNSPDKLKYNPCMLAIKVNMMSVVQLLDEYSQTFKSLYALRYAAVLGHAHLVKYLLSKYKYSLNDEYAIRNDFGDQVYSTAMQDFWIFGRVKSLTVAIMFLDHGADPNTKPIEEPNISLLHKAINIKGLSAKVLVVRLIRNGADINFKSFDDRLNLVYPFEASIKCDNIFAAEALLISGCSCGRFGLASNNKNNILNYSRRRILNLMEKWNIKDNRLKSLMQICRTVILIQLSPAAYKKIRLLPLPSRIIKYLSIPELDDIGVNR